MKRLATYGTAAAVVLGLGSSAGAAQNKNSAAEAEVSKAVHDVVATYGQGPAGLEKYFSFFADDGTMMRPQGRYDKASYYKFWKELNEKGGGVDSAEIKDLVIQTSPSGDAAVTTFQMPVTRRGPLAEGQTRGMQWNMSETWFKQNGKWVISSVSYWLTPPPPAAAPPAAR